MTPASTSDADPASRNRPPWRRSTRGATASAAAASVRLTAAHREAEVCRVHTVRCAASIKIRAVHCRTLGRGERRLMTLSPSTCFTRGRGTFRNPWRRPNRCPARSALPSPALHAHDIQGPDRLAAMTGRKSAATGFHRALPAAMAAARYAGQFAACVELRRAWRQCATLAHEMAVAHFRPIPPARQYHSPAVWICRTPAIAACRNPWSRS